MLPNAIFFDPGAVDAPTGPGSPPTSVLSYFPPNSLPGLEQPYTGFGGSDESYDAADFQNMLLGLLQQNPVDLIWDGNSPTPTTLDRLVLPSLHRPALEHYWAQHSDFNPSPGDITQTELGHEASDASQDFAPT